MTPAVTIFIISMLYWTYSSCASGEITHFRFRKNMTLTGQSSLPLSGVAHARPSSMLQCADDCVRSGGCRGFSVSPRPDRGHYCMITTDMTSLPLGEWVTYIDTDMTNASPTTAYPYVVIRTSGSVDFDRPWADYKSGFGVPGANHWMGLEEQHLLTSSNTYGLLVNMTDWSDNQLWAKYSTFSVGSEAEGYPLHVTGYDVTSTAGDTLNYDNGKVFSTYDNDNDDWSGGNCAAEYKGGWWARECHSAHPTGLYLPGGQEDYRGLTWELAPGYKEKYAFKTMSFKLVEN